MTDAHPDFQSWNDLNWHDMQAIGLTLAERHPELRIITLPDDQLAALISALPAFADIDEPPPEHIVSAVASAWIFALEGEDDSSPYEFLA